MFRYMKRHCKIAVTAMLLSILTQIITPVSVILEQKLLDYIVAGDMPSFSRILFVVAFIVFVTVSAYFLKTLVVNKLKSRYAENLRNDLFSGIMQQAYAKFYKKDTAEYISNIINDVNTVTQNYTSPILSIIGSGFSATISLVIMVVYSPLLTVVAVACSFVSFWIPIIITRDLRKHLINKSVQETQVSIQLKEALNGYETISTYGVFSGALKRFKDANHSLESICYKVAKKVSLLENSAVVIGKLARLITFFVAGTMAAHQEITVGTVFLFVTLYEYFSSDILLFSQCIPLLRGSKAVAEKLLALIDENNGTLDEKETILFLHKMDIKHLCFQYVPGIPVLRDVNFTLNKGEKTALVGPSGCGKTTLIRLISGNYNDYQGGIYFDGVERKEVSMPQMRNLLAVIHQQTFIFNDTIRNNICLGEKFTDEELSNALSISGVSKFIANIDGGIDGFCGEDGVNLSGGQKQRIALARALIRGVDFLILDEGTSAIDVETANSIEKELLNMQDLTLLTITHRIKDGLLLNYDSVIVMENGQIKERRYRK